MRNFPKVFLVIPHLGGGGAERVVELLARHLPNDKYDLQLVLVTASDIPEPKFRSSITIHRINSKRVRFAPVAFIKLIRRSKPDLILSSMFHLNLLVLALRPLYPRKVRILVRQNGTASAMLRDLRHHVLIRALARVVYPTANRIICQSAAMAVDLCREFAIPTKQTAVLPNPIDIETIRTALASNHSESEWTGTGPHLLSIARLRPEKGIDLLLHAFAEVKKHLPEADLTIVGDGPLRSQLEKLAEELGLNDCVRFAGSVCDPARFYLGASLFVLSSRHEGIPNALLEAAAAGLPIVSTPASDGLIALMSGDPGCWVSAETNSSSLAQTLISAIGAIRTEQRFPHEWIEDFSLQNAIAAYQSLIDETLSHGPQRRPA